MLRRLIKELNIYVLIFYLALITVVLPLALRQIAANDLWKSLYTGRYIAQKLEFPHHSAFTFSPVKAGIHDRHSWTWLGNLIFYEIYSLSGQFGLQLFRIILLIFVLVLVHSYVDFKAHPLVLLLLVVGVFGLLQKLLLRNAIFLLPGLTLLYWLWYQARFKKRDWLLWLLPALIIVWGNLHGSYLVGMGVCGLLVIGDFIDLLWRRAERKNKLWYVTSVLILLVSLLGVTYVKPLAPDYKAVNTVSRIFQMGQGGLLNATSQVGEKSKKSNFYQQIKKALQSTAFGNVYKNELRSDEFSFPLDDPTRLDMSVTLALLFTYILFTVLNSNQFRFALFLPFLVTTVVGLGYSRTVALVPLTVISFMLIKYTLMEGLEYNFSGAIKWVCVVGLALLGLNLYYRAFTQTLQKFTGHPYYEYGLGRCGWLGQGVPKYLLEDYKTERFYNHYDVGSWLIWNWWPEKKVFYDTKGSAYKMKFRRSYQKYSPPLYMQKNDYEYGVFPLHTKWIFYYFIPHPDWQIIALDSGLIAFKKREKKERVIAEKQSIFDKIRLSKQEFKELASPSRSRFLDVVEFILDMNNRKKMVAKFKGPNSYLKVITD